MVLLLLKAKRVLNSCHFAQEGYLRFGFYHSSFFSAIPDYVQIIYLHYRGSSTQDTGGLKSVIVRWTQEENKATKLYSMVRVFRGKQQSQNLMFKC